MGKKKLKKKAFQKNKLTTLEGGRGRGDLESSCLYFPRHISVSIYSHGVKLT